MPWSYPDTIPAVAQNWTADEQRRCIDAANDVLENTGDEEQAIYACIAAAGKERTMKTKTFKAMLEATGDGDAGEVEAVFATLNVIDYDGDVTLAGAFGSQPVIIEPWNHNYQAPPVGKGIISESENDARLKGRFFTDTASGLEHYRVVKNLAEQQEWSYTFQVLDAEPGKFDGQDVTFLKRLEVIGVSPVTRGAGIATRTVAIKRADKDASDDARETEGQTGDPGEPSGPPPRVLSTRIDIELLEEIDESP